MKELIEIQANLNAPKGQYNAFGKYKYRSCEDILRAVKKHLKEQRCVLTLDDDIVAVGDRVYVKATATIRNSAGETVTTTAFAREEETKKGMDASQVTGAASSYARKYALNGLFAIDDNRDADSRNTTAQYTQPTVVQQGSLLDVFNTHAKPAIAKAQTKEELTSIYNQYGALRNLQEFMSALTARRKELGL